MGLRELNFLDKLRRIWHNTWECPFRLEILRIDGRALSWETLETSDQSNSWPFCFVKLLIETPPSLFHCYYLQNWMQVRLLCVKDPLCSCNERVMADLWYLQLGLQMELIRFSTFETTDINLTSKDLHVFPRETVCYWAMQNQCSSSEVWMYLLVEHKRMSWSVLTQAQWSLIVLSDWGTDAMPFL